NCKLIIKMKKYIFLTSLVCSLFSIVRAQNPVIQTKFTADPAPMVYNDTVFLYTTHDDDNAPEGMAGFLMRNWLLYTSTDMVNWTDHGIVASLDTFDWPASAGWGNSENGAWAHQCIERNGKFYLYVTLHGRGIGVLVADSPYGPFTDPIGTHLISGDYDTIDPSVFIDDDGQAYLYWGNPNLWYVKLNEDMISYTGEIVKDASFAKEEGKEDPYHCQEGPWLYKRNDIYYMAYASTCCPEGMAYATSNSPVGPWDFGGYIMKPDGRSSGNHPGIIDYKGSTYVFGFNYKLNFMITDKHHERRSVAVAKMEFNTDGSIQELPWWYEGTPVEQLGTIDPYKRIEAETIAWSEGLKTDTDGNAGMYVTDIQDGDYLKVQGVDFKKGARSFHI